jgi:tetratricopeptide (TPR) repeat protein
VAVQKRHSGVDLLKGAKLCGLLIISVAAGLLMLRSANRQPLPKPALNSLNSSSTVAHYGGSTTCASCHEEEYRLWSKSHHGMAERALVPSRDGAAFATGQLNQTAKDFIPRTRGEEYQVSTVGLFRTQQVFGVVRVIGESPLRQFLVLFPGGRLQTLEVAYDPHSNDWFNVYGNENRQPGEWGHWTGRGMNWNNMCAGCHNTRVNKGYAASTDSYQTTMAEPTVACEACHGPLRAHNEWQTKFGSSGEKDPTLKKLTPEQTLDNCGFCHARRGELTGDFKPGDDFSDQMRLELVDGMATTYYPDGQVREEDYEYAAFLGSRMHFRGVRCTDCHDPHSGKTVLPGNWLCMRCHAGGYANAPIIDPVGHSHHKVFGAVDGSSPKSVNVAAYPTGAVLESGGECVNCHMPQTTYMQRHNRHDHGFTTPDPLLTKTANVPNACNRCHRDKDPDWALKWCNEWYGAKMERAARRRAMAIAAARNSGPDAATGLLELYKTSEIPYWRAAAAGSLEPWSSESRVRELLITGLSDTNALVRIGCVRALRAVAQDKDVSAAFRRSLSDPSRGVRFEAAWALRDELDLNSKAGIELQETLAHNSDQPIGQMQLAAFALARAKPEQAAAHYEKAIAWDPGSAGIRHDYAVVLARLHRVQDAVHQLEVACSLEPTNAMYQFSLALGCSDLGQTSNTIRYLREAVRLQPGFARAWYNLGLALAAAGSSEEALEALTRAGSADSSDPNAPYAQATILIRIGRTNEARRAARRALEIDPNLDSARELLQTIDLQRRGVRP